MKVNLSAIEKYIVSEFELRKLTNQLKETRPYLFKSNPRSSRSFRDHSRLVAKIQTFSKNISFDLQVYILPHASTKVILDKYKIDKEIKESTFSNTYVVILQVLRTQKRKEVLSQENQRR